MSSVAAPAPRAHRGAVRRLVRSLRPTDSPPALPGLVLGRRGTNLMVYLCTFGAAVAGAVMVGEALGGAPPRASAPRLALLGPRLSRSPLFGWLEVVVVHVMSFRLIDELRRRCT